MHLRPCLHCRHKHDCEIKPSILEGLCNMRLPNVGVKPTLMNFACELRVMGLKPGARVSVRLKTYRTASVPDGHTDYEIDCVDDIDATVMKHCKRKGAGKILLWLDAPIVRAFTADTMQQIIKVWPDRLTILGGTVPICEECGKPVGAKRINDYWCSENGECEADKAGDSDD